MKFNFRSNTRSGARRRFLQPPTVAEVEICEPRLLLTTPDILTPTDTATVTATDVDFSWAAVDNAESYELWVSSLETFEQIYSNKTISGTSITLPVEQLTLGKIRVWARANLVGGGTSGWSSGSNITVATAPEITGPALGVSRSATEDSTPEITWTSAGAAKRFEVWVTDLEAKATAEAESDDPEVSSYAKVYQVDNLTPQRDTNGDIVLDGSGNPVLEEVRSFVIPEDVTDADSDDLELNLGRYRIWIRSFDMQTASQPSAWSAAHTFEVGARPEYVSPQGTTFQNTPNLTWEPVVGATHYEVYVSEDGVSGPLFRRTIEADGDGAQSTQILLSETGRPIVEDGDDETQAAAEEVLLDEFGEAVPYELPNGDHSYRVWVRAIRQGDDITTIRGFWSTVGRFSTLTAPEVTAPVGQDTGSGSVVTEARPTIEWTSIDSAAAYEVLIHKYNSRPPFLEATSDSLSYTLTEDLPQGDYTVWVRGLDGRGEPSPWSQPFHFTASGGQIVVTSPTEGASISFPTFTWLADNEAASYELWVAELGVDFTAINVSGITDTNYTANSPLNDSTYRVWVRAIYDDGSFGSWSAPVTFEGNVLASNDSVPQVLPSLLNEETTAGVHLETVANVERAADPETAAADASPVAAADATIATEQESTVVTSEPAVEGAFLEALTQIAQECTEAEWWAADTSQQTNA